MNPLLAAGYADRIRQANQLAGTTLANESAAQRTVSRSVPLRSIQLRGITQLHCASFDLALWRIFAIAAAQVRAISRRETASDANIFQATTASAIGALLAVAIEQTQDDEDSDGKRSQL